MRIFKIAQLLVAVGIATTASAAGPAPSASPSPSASQATIATAASAPAPAPSAGTTVALGAGIKLPMPEVETLPNGLRVAWFVSGNLPVVDMQLVVNAGDRDDPAGKTGVASLLAEVMDRGSAGMTATEVARQVERLGASHAIAADLDSLGLSMHGLAPDASVLLDLLGKITLHPDFLPDEVKREQARLLDRWAHLTDYGDSLAALLYQRVIESGSTYGRGGFLSPEELRTITRDDLVNFYKRYFTPGNSVLVIVGRISRAKFGAQIAQVFGAWQGGVPTRHYLTFRDAAVTKIAPKARSASSPTVLIVDRPGLTQAQVRLGFRAPPVRDPRHYSLALGNAMLGEYFNSRLNKLIRDQLGLTYGIGSSYSYDKDFATFTIESATANETVGQLIRKTLEVLEDFRKGPIPDDEVRMARDYLVGSFPLRTSTLEAVAAGWLNASLLGLPDDYVNEFVPKVNAVRPEEVLSAVQETFDLKHMTVVVAGDAAAIEPTLKELHLVSKRIPVRALISGRSK